MRKLNLFLAGIVLCICIACNKKKINNCDASLPVTANALVGELVGDSAIATDTAFTGTVIFQSLQAYDFIEWKVGGDLRTFNSEAFSLNFASPETGINVVFSVRAATDAACFPEDDGKDSKVFDLTVLPRDSTAKIPLIGKYSGYIQGKPLDTFTVSIDFRNDKRYWRVLGQAPFYTLSNFPKGFRDTTSSIGTTYPELSYGYACDWGYRAIYFNEDYKQAQHVKGYATLASRDSLIINYTRADLSAPFNPQTGYPRIQERFIGVRIK